MVILSHPTGNANVREAARALNDVGLLSEFWTSVCWHREHALNSVLPRSVSSELNRRTFPQLHRDQVHCYPWLEIGRLVARRLSLKSLIRHEAGPFCVDAVYRSLDARVAARLRSRSGVGAIYAYEDGALASFRAAQQLGITTIYELPIGYWRYYQELMEQEAALAPEWAMTLPGNIDSVAKRDRKDEELASANHIVVASEFVRRTLLKAGPFKAPVSVVPYGAPPIGSVVPKPRGSNQKLKVVFVGLLSQRKGIRYLLEAIRPLGSRIELTLIGRRVGECRALDSALRVHRWIASLSHGELLQEIARHDVMVFPSLFEGFGLVLLEAMSQGVPVIATPNGGAPDFVGEGEDGFIVPIRDAEAITERLEVLLRDSARLRQMSQAAIHKATQHSWAQYRNRLANTVQQALAQSAPTYSGACHSAQLPACDPC
jgi:starch synthase